MNSRIQIQPLTLAVLFLTSLLLCACDREGNRDAVNGAPVNPAPTTPQPALSLSNTRVMQVLPGKSITSGYFDLHNNLTTAVELVGASSPAVRSIEMHEIVQDGDNVSMRRLASVVIEAGASVEFTSGAKHLMLFGVTELPENLNITFKFADGRETAATFRQQRW